MKITITVKLQNIQRREGLDDIEFARKLGLHRVSWNRIKNGRANLGEKVLRNAVRAYPELMLDVMEYLSK